MEDYKTVTSRPWVPSSTSITSGERYRMSLAETPSSPNADLPSESTPPKAWEIDFDRQVIIFRIPGRNKRFALLTAIRVARLIEKDYHVDNPGWLFMSVIGNIEEAIEDDEVIVVLDSATSWIVELPVHVFLDKRPFKRSLIDRWRRYAKRPLQV